MINKKVIKGLSDRRLKILFDEGRWVFILKRGVCNYGGNLFFASLLIFRITGDGGPIEIGNILFSLVVNIIAGLLFGRYFWGLISDEYSRRMPLSEN